MEHVLNALEQCGSQGTLPMELNSIIDTLVMYVNTRTIIKFNNDIDFLIRILCNELVHGEYPAEATCDAIIAIVQKCTIDIKANVAYCVCGFGRTAQCRLCLFRQHGRNMHMCIHCSGVYQGDDYQLPVQPFININNVVMLLNRLGFYQIFGVFKNGTFGSHTKVFDYYYPDGFGTSNTVDHPEYLAIVQTVCPNDGDRTAFRVCLGYRYSYRHQWQPMNKCLQRWNTNRTICDHICSFLVASHHYQQLFNKVAT